MAAQPNSQENLARTLESARRLGVEMDGAEKLTAVPSIKIYIDRVGR